MSLEKETAQTFSLKKWIGLGALAVLAIYAFMTYSGLVGLQNSMQATFKNNQQVYSSVLIQIESTGAIAKAGTDQQIKGATEAIAARYGKDGAKGVMTWIQEQNPNIDTKLYAKVQQIVQIGYTRFEANQRTLIDKTRIYQNMVTIPPSSMVAKIFGFTMEEIAPYTTILISNDATNAFQTGVMGAPKLGL